MRYNKLLWGVMVLTLAERTLIIPYRVLLMLLTQVCRMNELKS